MFTRHINLKISLHRIQMCRASRSALKIQNQALPQDLHPGGRATRKRDQRRRDSQRRETIKRRGSGQVGARRRTRRCARRRARRPVRRPARRHRRHARAHRRRRRQQRQQRRERRRVARRARRARRAAAAAAHRLLRAHLTVRRCLRKDVRRAVGDVGGVRVVVRDHGGGVGAVGADGVAGGAVLAEALGQRGGEGGHRRARHRCHVAALVARVGEHDERHDRWDERCWDAGPRFVHHRRAFVEPHQCVRHRGALLRFLREVRERVVYADLHRVAVERGGILAAVGIVFTSGVWMKDLR